MEGIYISQGKHMLNNLKEAMPGAILEQYQLTANFMTMQRKINFYLMQGGIQDYLEN